MLPASCIVLLIGAVKTGLFNYLKSRNSLIFFNINKFRIFVFYPVDRKFHIGLSRAEPDNSKHHVFNGNALALIVRNNKLIRSAALLCRKIYVESTLVVALSCNTLTCETCSHFRTCIVPSPDMNAFSPLNNTPVR